ncbi:uncharacterized protein (TIGR02145 family) [Parabacteroides sp. PF5-5]|uniref:FISUMP domain-containing protein n=1 Tax=unclassified Parabacteroides TaxID=2649774 RepID=UPI002476734B|nr:MULTISPECIES: FISUMP domain-containing protein [unclassified Parabacteroides]MDH6304366.1 uncharacterized protein (TIGR02145 family) [Parabacteroides sp. PH5-39]MDH6315481.1 uncharacterized protein (TIGR02145 family) [Parabacteroides sp. PF5-13]MDH6319025.1 uncharacterized protein (TIGR02145 family) [Parabacteroides sp. PH5-13]MDH6322755.1 uncharacterized protein (TIGR02145 family) [Parabacteroides sp. PH5-8]MDH6326673.1 uncharacterized protein (TIGR02145 family) [Parabacteroides sp. PH5-41
MKTKHTKLTILLAALVLMLVPSCSQEEFSNPPIKGEGGGSITFRLQGKRQPVSYATIATQQENVVDSLEIYMFSDRSAESKPNLLQKVFRLGSTDLNQTNADLETTIDVTGRMGKHIFYFVANGKDNASSLANINVGATTEEAFRERMTDIQTNLIKSPLLMTTRQEIVDIETPTDEEKKVKLYRRVARFDVENDASDTNFTIDNILVENVKQQGYAFGDATGTPAQTFATGKLPMIKNNDPSDFNIGTPVASAFYLYPTKLEDGQTVISFEGEFMGERRIYSLKGGTEIEANKRYILKIKKIAPNTPSLIIEREDWGDDGGEYEVEPKTDDMEIGALSLTPNTGIQVTGKTYDITDATSAGVVTIPVTSYTKSGTRMEVTYLHGTGNSDTKVTFNNSEAVLTYAAGYFQEYKINIPKPGKTPMHARVEIINNSRPEIRDTIYVKSVPNYDTTQEKPVLFGGIYWAPVNVGATEIGTTTDVKHHGLLFQWGRNIGFVYNGEKGTTPDVYPIMGAVSWEVAMEGDAKGLFIKSNSASGNDWLFPQDDSLWSGDKQRGPCPEGWRVPTKTELELIKTAYGTSYTANGGTVIWKAEEKRIEVKGDNLEKVLYFPAVGDRSHGSGNSTNQGMHGYYWSSDPFGLSLKILNFSASTLLIGNSGRAVGRSVRCVQE